MIKVESFRQLVKEINSLQIEDLFHGFKGFRCTDNENRFEMMSPPNFGIYEHSAVVYCGPDGDVWKLYKKGEKGDTEYIKSGTEKEMCQLYYNMVVEMVDKNMKIT